jgi:CheY-like chemotaxis protein
VSFDVTHLSVLLADDDDACRESLGQFFLREGFHVYFAATGLEAIDVLKKGQVNFSVMDVQMPGLTGIQVLEILRSDGRVGPCIFVSGETSRELQLKAMSAGAFTFLSKPVELGIMRFTVQLLLKKFFPGTEKPF